MWVVVGTVHKAYQLLIQPQQLRFVHSSKPGKLFYETLANIFSLPALGAKLTDRDRSHHNLVYRTFYYVGKFKLLLGAIISYFIIKI